MTTTIKLATAIVTGMEDAATTTANYDRLMQLLETTYAKTNPDRYTRLCEMYEALRDRVMTAPASSKANFHNAYPGGYLEHILHVHDIAVRMSSVFGKSGGTVDYTREEMVFAAIHHDLGKLGSDDGAYYEPQDSKWHRDTLGQLYQYNTDRQFMTVHDAGIMWLSKFGITYTAKEFLAIKLADGVYDEGNKRYLMNNDGFPMRTALPYIIHWSDHMATVAEKFAVLNAMEDE